MSFRIKKTCILLFSALVLASCSATGSTDQRNSSVSSSSKAKSKKVEVAAVKSVKTGLSQRPSDINIDVKGRVTRTGEVYLLRGLANVFSRGMDTMGAKMVRRGLDARVYNHGVWKSLADNIIARRKQRKVSYPIIIMGHSLGANATMMMADYLGRNGVKVSYAVGFDPTVTSSVGKNVGRVVNFYLPNKSNSNVVKKSNGFRGSMRNVNMSGVRDITHLNIEKDTRLQSQVIRRALSYTKRRRRR